MQKKTVSSTTRQWEEELMALIKAEILAEPGTSMLAQANVSMVEMSRLLQKDLKQMALFL